MDEVELLPRRFHFYWEASELQLVNYLAVKSLLDHHPGDEVFLHYQNPPCQCPYWKRLAEIPELRMKPYSLESLLRECALSQFDCDSFESRAKANHRSDLARYLLLYRYGGIYLDMDVLVLKPLLPLLKFGFFAAFQYYGRGRNNLNGAILGSRAGEPILWELLKGCAKAAGTEREYTWAEFGPTLLTDTLLPSSSSDRMILLLLAALERLSLANSSLADALVRTMSRKQSIGILPRDRKSVV